MWRACCRGHGRWHIVTGVWLRLCVRVCSQVVVQDLVTRRQEILPGVNTIASLAASTNGRLLACSGDGCDAFGRSPVSLWRLTEDDGWRLLGNRYYHDTVITSLHFSADCRCEHSRTIMCSAPALTPVFCRRATGTSCRSVRRQSQSRTPRTLPAPCLAVPWCTCACGTWRPGPWLRTAWPPCLTRAAPEPATTASWHGGARGHRQHSRRPWLGRCRSTRQCRRRRALRPWTSWSCVTACS